MSKNKICEYNLCTGCAACMNICPKDAIGMKEDVFGFKHPKIDPQLCIDCNLCETVCPVLQPLDLNLPKKTYAAESSSSIEHSSSSSGGAASVISRWIVENGGVVYGCSQDNYKNIRHIRVDNVEDISLLKGSKYVQSDVGLCFRDVRKDLRSKRTVLFVGTPCQVAGLKCFLKKEYENLFTADLICHGVPSQKMLRENIEEANLFDKTTENIKVNFRWKSLRGIQFGIQYYDRLNKKILYSKALPYDPYILAFFTGMSFRENCHKCPYSKSERVGDITIGDFWRLGAYKSTNFKIKNGVSLILINSIKGESLMALLKERFILEERSLAEAVAGNANLSHPSPRPLKKDLFLSSYQEGGLRYACQQSITKKQYFTRAFIEFIKRQETFVSLFKKIRLLIHKLK